MSTLGKDGISCPDHEFCLRCGRRLKNPDRRRIGYGIVCEKKMKTKKKGGLFKIAEVPSQI